MTAETEGRDFWSRRKQAVEAERRADLEAREDGKADEARKTLEERPDEEVLAELDLPDPDSLKQGDDFSAFMAKAVPERLRRRALRRLWLSNPVLANLDELLDYGEDFTDAATVVADLQSVYRVGKGMVRDEDLAEAAGDAAEPEAEPAEEEAADDPDESETASAPEEDAPEPGDPEPDEDAPPEPPARRHMRFAFAEPDGGGTGGPDE
ncbi:MAG: DUF3306 domain-containing protein [Defluviicoccus sp.]|nr:DUF3306 domain-containing protein [Defluviicoccus sp.]MDE0277956.1 DUF3306 domain-containing protein [Defluviicoccus sp.]